MDRYIVQNNVAGQQVNEQDHPKPQPTYIMQEAGSSKMMDNNECDSNFASNHNDRCKVEGDSQYANKPIDTSQFNEGVGNTTYIIDNNSSNSIDSVRIGNQSFVPVVDSSQLYNISVAGGGAQYTIEGVVNSGLGNYILEPTYIVQAKPGQEPMYIQPEMPPLQPIPTVSVEEKRPVKKAKKTKEDTSEAGTYNCHLCNAEFSSQSSLRFHSYHHNPRTRRYNCIGCERGFEKDREKEEHEFTCDANFSGVKFKCMFCDLPFSTPKNLRNHEKKHRPSKKTKKYKHMCVCIKCGKAFDAIYTLKTHIKKIHEGNASPDKKKKLKKTDESQEDGDKNYYDDSKEEDMITEQQNQDERFLALS